MKNCPYCSEQIQDEAIKCKHCGEWLNKTNTDFLGSIKGAIQKGVNFVEEQKKIREEKRYSHLFIPTNSHPFCYKGIKVYESYLTFNERRIDFDDIFGIFYYGSTHRYIGFNVSSTTIFQLWISNTDKISVIPESAETLKVFNNSPSSKKEMEIIRFLHSLIEEKTLRHRLNRYVSAIKKDGYFTYLSEVKIYNNGDMHTKDGKVINLKKAYEEGLLSFGSYLKGLRTSSYDPYVLKIYPSDGIKVALLGFELNKRFEINTMFNHDIFEGIIQNIISKGYALQI